MDKYYIPEIEEFHVGFECEYQNIENAVWGLFKHPNLDSLPLDHELEFIRVKYLDKEDIESLGFIKCANIKQGKIGAYWNPKNYVAIQPWDNKYYIYKNYTMFDREELIFQGTIKNKSELKRLMKQLSID